MASIESQDNSRGRVRLTEREAQKRAAAERAVELVQSGMRLGLGTRSNSGHVVDVTAERRPRGELHDSVGVATATPTEQQARAQKIPNRAHDDVQQLDLGIDGADEVDPQLNLIKGLGGEL